MTHYTYIVRKINKIIYVYKYMPRGCLSWLLVKYQKYVLLFFIVSIWIFPFKENGNAKLLNKSSSTFLQCRNYDLLHDKLYSIHDYFWGDQGGTNFWITFLILRVNIVICSWMSVHMTKYNRPDLSSGNQMQTGSRRNVSSLGGDCFCEFLHLKIVYRIIFPPLQFNILCNIKRCVKQIISIFHFIFAYSP